MPRSLTIHPASLAIGLVLATVCFLSMGQTTIAPTPLGSTVRVQYMPQPRDYVQIREGTSYTVPSGRVLAITALGHATGSTNQPSFNVKLKVNGQEEVTAYYSDNSGVSTVMQLATGLNAHAGEVVEVATLTGGGTPHGRAWGYLAPQ